MGGKTQQRVAGNAKPTSSGRIRELLINKQNGVGNIITFSALQSPGQSKPDVSPSSSSTTAKLSPEETHGLNYKIRPDRRRCIPMPSEITLQQPTPSTSTIHNNNSGVSSETNSNENKILEKNNATSETEEVEESPKQVHDFDSLLDRLALAQVACDENSFKSFKALNKDIIDQECELIDTLRILVLEFCRELSLEEWDLITRSIYKWVGLISDAPNLLEESRERVELCEKVFAFFHQLLLVAKGLKESLTELEREDNPLLNSLLDDLWGNFHSSGLYKDLITLYLKWAFTSNLNQDNLSLVESLASIIVEIDAKSIVSNINLSSITTIDHSQAELDADYKLPENCLFCLLEEKKYQVFYAICSLLRSHHRVVSVSAHSILSKYIEDIADNVGSDSADLENDTEELLFAPPAVLMSILTSRDSIMSALLSDFQVGDISVTIDPNSDSYACAMSYMLIWDLVIQFIVKVEKQVGHRIIHCLKLMGLIQRLLNNIFMLLPPLGERDSLNFRIDTASELSQPTYDQNKNWTLSSFLKSPLKTTMKRPINEIELVALHVYFSVASHMPVTVRKWYNNNSNKKLCNMVNEYTVKHISKIICSLEMESVLEQCKERADEYKNNNLVIKARPTANEVYAIYTRDEFRVELTIKLPHNYPLGTVQVDGGKRVGVTDLKWRSWLLQLTTFLSHQNGPLLDGIDLWRRNIDKRFEGVEKCMICFSILHSNYQLPKKKCQTCNHMFHNLCLYKWFKTSGNSNCPLCRNIW